MPFQDQRIHMDFPTHTFLHPPPFDNPEVVALIIYMDDESECGGPTAVVAREGDQDPFYQPPYINQPGVGEHEWINDRQSAERYFEENDPAIYAFRQNLYAKEKYVRYKKGTVLLYRLDVWHRGTPMKSGSSRIVMNLAYKKASHHWLTCWEEGYAVSAYNSRLWGLIPQLTEDQRELLGYPRESHSFWQEGNNVANVAARYRNQHRHHQQPKP